MKKFITSAALGVAILGGTAAYTVTSVLPAYAQNPGQTQGQAQAPTQGQDAQGQHGSKHLRHRVGKAALKTSADTIGIPPKDLLTELKAGKSVADVATEHGKNPQDVINALVAQVNTKVDEAVSKGKLTADRATEIKTKAPDRITKLVNAHRQPGQHANGKGQAKDGAAPAPAPANG